MAERIPLGVAIRVPLQAVLASDHLSPATGLTTTIVVTISKNGAAYAAPNSADTSHEISDGSYYVDLNTTDTGTAGPLFVHAAVATMDPITVIYNVASFVEQTGDSFARLGAPAGASVSADVAAVKVDTAAVLVDTGTTLDARIPAALVAGRMDASVGAMAAGVLTAAAIDADAITDAKVAADVTISSVTGAVGSVTGAVGSVTGAVGSVTAAVTLPTIPANWIAAAGIAAGALDGKGNWNVGKTGYALTQAFPTNFADLAITASTGRVTVGTNADKTGYSISGAKQTLDALNDLAAGAAMILTSPYDAAKTAATQSSVNLIKTVTDQFQFTVANKVDANALTGTGGTGSGAAGSGAITWTYTLTNSQNGQPIADAAVWVSANLDGTNVLASGTTDVNGVVTFYLNAAATIYVWRRKAGWQLNNPDIESVVAP